MPRGTKIRRLRGWPSAWYLAHLPPGEAEKLSGGLAAKSKRDSKTWHKRQRRALLKRAGLKYGSHLAGGPSLTAQYDSEGILTLYRVEPDGTLTPILDHGIVLAGY